MKQKLPTIGSVRHKHNPNTPRSAYVMLIDTPHGMEIHHHRPKKGDVVKLTENEAHHLMLEGILEPASAAVAAAAPADEVE